MQTLYFSTETEAWIYTIPADCWWFTPVPATRVVQFCTVEAAEAYLGVTLHAGQDERT